MQIVSVRQNTWIQVISLNHHINLIEVISEINRQDSDKNENGEKVFSTGICLGLFIHFTLFGKNETTVLSIILSLIVFVVQTHVMSNSRGRSSA